MPSTPIYINKSNWNEFQKLENKSGVINKLLEDYLNRTMSIEQKKQQLKEIEIMEEAQAKIAELRKNVRY